MTSKREQLLDIMEDAAKGETKATLRAQITALQDENERLKKALSEQIDRDISGIFPAERALAERAGGVKVKALLDGGIDGPYNEPAAPDGQQVCATDSCENHATNEFVRGDVGSFYCGDCFVKVIDLCETQTTHPAEQAVTGEMVEAARKEFHRTANMRAALEAALRGDAS